MMPDKKNKLQLIWGVLLLIAGVGVFFRIPQLMPEIKKIEQFSPYYIPFIYFCFYLLGILLIFGGGKKIYLYTQKSKEDNTKE